MNHYSITLNKELQPDLVRSEFGFYPEGYDVNILNEQYGLFPINDPGEPTRDTNLYSGFTHSLVPNADGNTYDKVYQLVERPLDDAKVRVIAKLRDQAEHDSIVAMGAIPIGVTNDAFVPNGPYQKVGGESELTFCAQSYLASASRIEPYKTMATSINAIATELQDTIGLVEAATAISDILDVYRPVSGAIDITRSGNNITSGVFTLLVNTTTHETTLRIVSSGYICNYDQTNGFTALGGQLGAGAQDVELLVGAHPIATLTIPTENKTTSFTF